MGGEQIWMCCLCGNGPSLVAVQISCHECEHTICSNCERIRTVNHHRIDKSTTNQIQYQYMSTQESTSFPAQDPGPKSALVLQSLPSSPSFPLELQDAEHEDVDMPGAPLSECASNDLYSPIPSSGDGEASTETSSATELEDTEHIAPYEGPLIVLNDRALHIILDAYEQLRTTGSGDGSEQNEASPPMERAVDGRASGAESRDGHSSDSSGKKRKEPNRDEDEDGGEQRKKSNQRRTVSGQNAETTPLLACPFYKANSRKHRRCCASKLSTMTRVK